MATYRNVPADKMRLALKRLTVIVLACAHVRGIHLLELEARQLADLVLDTMHGAEIIEFIGSFEGGALTRATARIEACLAEHVAAGDAAKG